MSIWLGLLNLLITLGVVIGGFVAYHYGFSHTANEVQDRVIHALESEIQALHDRIAALEKENTRLSQTIATICTALKQSGIRITIDGDIVSIYDYSERRSYNTRIYGVEETGAAEPCEATPSSSVPDQGKLPAKRRGKRSGMAAQKRVQDQEA